MYQILMYYVVLFCQQKDASPSLTPSVGGGEDGSLTTDQKMQLLERKREAKLESKKGLDEQLKEDKDELEKQLKEFQVCRYSAGYSTS